MSNHDDYEVIAERAEAGELRPVPGTARKVTIRSVEQDNEMRGEESTVEWGVQFEDAAEVTPTEGGESHARDVCMRFEKYGAKVMRRIVGPWKEDSE